MGRGECAVGDFSCATGTKTRYDLGKYLDARGYTSGVELGVQRGRFSRAMLAGWPRCERYELVDLWAQQSNYVDGANVDDRQQGKIYAEAMRVTRPWASKVGVCRNLTTACAARYADASFDFIYLDARHDYKGVAEDLRAWMPKLRPGGIIAGHDYMDAATDRRFNKGDRWEVNGDGTVDVSGRAVQGAVEEYFAPRGHEVHVVQPSWPWRTWLVDMAAARAPALRIPRVLHFFDHVAGVHVAAAAHNGTHAEGSRRAVREWQELNPGWSAMVWTRELVDAELGRGAKTGARGGGGRGGGGALAHAALPYAALSRFGGVYIGGGVAGQRRSLESVRRRSAAVGGDAFTLCDHADAEGPRRCARFTPALFGCRAGHPLADAALRLASGRRGLEGNWTALVTEHRAGVLRRLPEDNARRGRRRPADDDVDALMPADGSAAPDECAPRGESSVDSGRETPRASEAEEAALARAADSMQQRPHVLLLAPSHDVAVDFGALIARSQFPSRCERFLVLDDNVPQSEKPLSSLNADYPGLSPKPLAFALSVAVLTRRVLVAPANASRRLRSLRTHFEPWTYCPSPPAGVIASAPQYALRGRAARVPVMRFNVSAFHTSRWQWNSNDHFRRDEGRWYTAINQFLFRARPWVRHVAASCVVDGCSSTARRNVALVAAASPRSANAREAAWVANATTGSAAWMTCRVPSRPGASAGRSPELGAAAVLHAATQADRVVTNSFALGQMVAHHAPAEVREAARFSARSAGFTLTRCAGTPGASCTIEMSRPTPPLVLACRKVVTGELVNSTLALVDGLIRDAEAASVAGAATTRPVPHTIHFVFYDWSRAKSHRDTLPSHYDAYQASWAALHPTWERRLWRDGANRKLLEESYPWFLPFFDHYTMPVKQSDSIRPFILHRHGGVYADLDVLALQPFESLLAAYERPTTDVLLGTLSDHWREARDGQNIPNALMISRPRAVFWLRFMREMVARFTCDGTATPMRETGAEILFQLVAEDKRAARDMKRPRSVVLLPPAALFPIDWRRNEWFDNVTKPTHRERHLMGHVRRWTNASWLREHGVVAGNASWAITFWSHGWAR